MALDKTRQAHRLAGLVYLLYALGFLFGITALIGVMVNHTQISKTTGTFAYSHFIWQIFSFWTLFAGVVLAIYLLPDKTAFFASLIWWACSAVFGIWFLIKKQPVPFPTFNQH